VRQEDGHGHERGRLVAGKAKHHALVAGADCLDLVVFAVHLAALEFLRAVDAHGDVRALRRDGNLHAAGIAVEALVAAVKTDILDNLAHQIVEVHKGRGRDLAQAHDEAGLDRGLARHTRRRVLLHDRVEHRVADLVAHLVRVPLRHRFAGEEEAWGSHKGSHCIFLQKLNC